MNYESIIVVSVVLILAALAAWRVAEHKVSGAVPQTSKGLCVLCVLCGKSEIAH